MAKSSTSFKKGNKAALFNAGGRPRNYDILEEAKALVEWASGPDALVLNAFGPSRGYSSKSMYQWETESPVFLEAMDIARDLIGARRQEILIQNGNARPFDRYATLLDKRLHAHEKQEKLEELALKAQQERLNGATEEQQQAHELLVKQIKELQESASKLAKSNRSTETRS